MRNWSDSIARADQSARLHLTRDAYLPVTRSSSPAGPTSAKSEQSGARRRRIYASDGTRAGNRDPSGLLDSIRASGSHLSIYPALPPHNALQTHDESATRGKDRRAAGEGRRIHGIRAAVINHSRSYGRSFQVLVSLLGVLGVVRGSGRADCLAGEQGRGRGGKSGLA
jgi:hypothetical protein